MIRQFISKTAKLLPIVAVFLIIAEVVATNQLAGLGEAATGLDMRIESLREENAHLSQQVASASSLIMIEQKAKEYGFTEAKPSSYLSLDEHLPIALVGNQ